MVAMETTSHGTDGSAAGSGKPKVPINIRSEDYGELQRVIDALFLHAKQANRLDLVVLAESNDLADDLLEIVSLLPPGTYTRARMCDQLNSALTAHGWGQTYGTVS
jgi:hypothetical protein